MSSDCSIDRLINRRWAAGTAVVVRYLRPGGNNANDGLSPASAWANSAAGLEHGLRYLAMASLNRPVALDVTGCTLAAEALLQLGGIQLGGIDFDFDITTTGPSNFAGRQNCQIRATPAVVGGLSALTITGTAANATTGLRTVTVTDVLTPGAHVGQFLLGEGLGEWAVIAANDANTLTVTTTVDVTGWTGDVGVYEPGATLEFGSVDPFNFNGAIHLMALCDWNLSGLALTISAGSTAAAALVIWPTAPVFLQLCSITGLDLQGGLDSVYVDACYLTGVIAQDGGAVTMRNCFLEECTPSLHGSGGKGTTYVIQCIMDGLTIPWGAGNTESEYSCAVSASRFSNGNLDGVEILFGIHSYTDVLIEGSSGDAVAVSNNATCRLTHVTGTGNGGWGVDIQSGAHVRCDNTCSVTGTAGDISLGNAGTFAWAAPLEEVDLGQLVRISVAGGV